MITTKKELRYKVYEDYESNDQELTSWYFDFDVDMPVYDILDAYAEIQYAINGDDVMFPENVTGHYNGNCKDFLESCNNKPNYVRLCDDVVCDFVF